MIKISALCVAVLVVFVQAGTELSPITKECIKQTNIDVDTVRTYIGGSKIPEDNEVVQNFFTCVFGDSINDANEVIVNEKVLGFAKKMLFDRVGSDFADLDVVTLTLLNACATLKGDNKGLTAIKVINCYGAKVAKV